MSPIFFLIQTIGLIDMKTKELAVNTENNFRVCLNIEVPKSIDTTPITSNEVQVALNHFLRQNPQILRKIFEASENEPTHLTKRQQSIPLPRVTKKQREAILSSLKEDSYPGEDANSEKWIRNIKSYRINKEYSHPFFDE